MNPTFQKYIFDLKARFLKPNLYKVHLENEKLLHSDQLTQVNFAKRCDLVRHALKHSPFYAGKYKALGIDPEKITEAEFAMLPTVTREELRINFKDFKADNVRSMHYKKLTTSGSTGPSISVLQDKRFPIAPMQWRLLQWWGIKPYENKAFIYRYRRSFLKKVFNKLLWWPTQRIFLAGSEMTQANIEKFIKTFNKVQPALLQGYVDVMYEFALFLKDNQITINPPKAVWVTAGPLTNQQRKTMQEVFHAPVYDQYGSTEVFIISAECQEQKGLHIMQDRVHIECVDENDQPLPQNKWGKILITDLYNYAFPLIRYDIGDYGRLLDYKCACGRSLPLMDQISGRQSDFVETTNGRKIHSNILTSIFDNYPDSVRTYQIKQLRDYSLELYYVPMNGKKIDNILDSVISKLSLEMDSEVPIIPIKVDKITKVNGKARLIISQL